MDEHEAGEGEVEERELWGGAMAVAMPPSFLDVSQIRTLDDTVEMFLDTESGDSVIFEIMAHDAALEAPAAAQAFFDDICDGNDANEEGLHGIDEALADVRIGQVGDDEEDGWRAREVQVAGLRGWQRAQRPSASRGERDLIQVQVVVVRLPEVASDVVIHYNHRVPEASEAAASESAGGKRAREIFWTTIVPSFRVCSREIFA